MDEVVQQLVEAARVHTSRPLVVCALGGCGRRTLCLHSDIDLMILFENSIGRDEERFVNAVLQPLWDLQLVVGHQVRELADFDDLDTGNTEFLLSALDARRSPATISSSPVCRNASPPWSARITRAPSTRSSS